MDTKSLARSKRAHSLRHTKKNNVHSASKVPSISSGTGTSSKKQVGENLQKHHGSKPLPSNWDRYGEEFELGPGDPAGEGSSNPTEFVVPKTKGADYVFLISEAKSQPQLNNSADIFPSFSGVLDDFTQGFGPMLSAKGQNLLSWIAEDDFDFDFEDKASASYEAPFLSLNLHALAEQLEKIKLSERLYVDPNVLPPELLNDELQSSGEDEHDHVQTSVSAVGMHSEASSPSQKMEENKNKNAQHLPVPVSTVTTVTTQNLILTTAKEALHSTNQIMDDIWKLQETGQESISKSYLDSAARKLARFEASIAEAELDVLLNSFSETKFLEPSTTGKKFSNGFELHQETMPNKPSIGISSAIFSSAEIETKTGGMDTWKTPRMSAKIDNAIDNLLEETSNLVKFDGGTRSREVKASLDDTKSNLNTSSKSKLLDDFDSWLDTI